MNEVRFKRADRHDTGLVLNFIRELAKYEEMEDEVIATEELLEEWLFEKKIAEVIFPLEDGKEVGFALFFHNFSTFLGRAGIYLEDLYIMPRIYIGQQLHLCLLRKPQRVYPALQQLYHFSVLLLYADDSFFCLYKPPCFHQSFDDLVGINSHQLLVYPEQRFALSSVQQYVFRL